MPEITRSEHLKAPVVDEMVLGVEAGAGADPRDRPLSRWPCYPAVHWRRWPRSSCKGRARRALCLKARFAYLIKNRSSRDAQGT
jgi:hypothetical protein